jgi:hypothetical protein
MTNPLLGSKIGEIPHSDALAEATIDSLSELMSKDPEGLTRRDRDKIVDYLREQRKNFAIAEAQPKAKKPKAEKVPVSNVSNVSAEDLF